MSDEPQQQAPATPMMFIIDAASIRNYLEGKPAEEQIINQFLLAKTNGLPATALTTPTQILHAVLTARPTLHAPEHECPHCHGKIPSAPIPAHGLERLQNFITVVPIGSYVPASPARGLTAVTTNSVDHAIGEMILIAGLFNQGGQDARPHPDTE